ncbi:MULTISPECIES: hypothetical protein [Streptomyces]|uniref:Uncharacterized protein n=1 Tax=Streptomyces muensis TaxID=1077944 RepID=A0A9X1PUC3_STRM4|nr:MULTISPECIES: hypothetical protein [Streptomyces]MCF1592409.1 hypothetical protein [Streptomyces muensis]QKV98203.1 hypothetical protein HUT19_41515 [Streptomyces sp. NA02950]
MPRPLARIHRSIRAQTIGNLLIKSSGGRLQRRKKVGIGRTGTRSPRCSGFLASQQHGALVQVHYVHDEGDGTETSERIEADRDREIQALLLDAGYTAEILDNPNPGAVGVHVRRLDEPTEEEWQALRLIADRQVTHRPGASSVTGLADPDLFQTLFLSHLATTTRESDATGATFVRLTEAGEALLADRLTTGTGETMVQVLESKEG